MILMARVIVKPCTLHHRRTIQFTFNLVNVIFLVHLRCNFYVNILPPFAFRALFVRHAM